jgi:flagellar hook-length control protein FliK
VVSRAAEKPADSDSADRRSSEVNSGKENPADQTSAQDPALADQGTDGATGTVLSGADAKAAQALALAAAVTGPGSAAEATGTGLAGEQPGVPDASVSAVGISAVGVPAITKTTGPEVAGTQTATAQVGGDQAAGTQTVSNQAGPASGSAAGDGAAGNGAAGSGGNTGAGDGSATGTSTDASGGAGKSGATPGAGPVAGGAQAAATGTAVNIAIPVTRQGNGQVVADATTKVDQAASVAGSDADPVGIAAPATLAPNSLASAPTAERVAGATPPPVVEQVVNRLSMLRSGPDGTHKLTMRLDPVELGPIKIIAEVREGSLKLELIAAVPAAQDTLRQAMGELRRELANAGFSSATVNVQQGGPDSGAAQTSSNGLTGGSGGSGNGQPSGDRPGWTSTGTGWAAPETDHQAVRLGAGGRSAVDVRV